MDLQAQWAGFLNVHKPPGLSSHGVVAAVRHLLPKGVKVGHLGTLDPDACGVLPLALGWATRTIPYFPPARKAYRAEVQLGVETDTLDASGQVVSRAPVPPLEEGELRALIARGEGPQWQVPPQVSAVHVNGRRAYHLSREGSQFELPARQVEFYKLELLQWEAGGRLLVDLFCSPGTYVRAWARDLGRQLGCGAHLCVLLRLESGFFRLEGAWTIGDLEEKGVYAALLPLKETLMQAVGRIAYLPEQRFQGGQDYLQFSTSEGEDWKSPEVASGEEWVVCRAESGSFLGLGRTVDSPGGVALRLERLLEKGA